MIDRFFWLAQPTTMLHVYDKWAIYLFAFLFIVGMVLAGAVRFIRHPVIKKLVRKLVTKDLTLGGVGLIWAGMRYENTPIFAKRFWAGLILLILIVWLLYIFRYLLFAFQREKSEYDEFQVKNKYMPRKK